MRPILNGHGCGAMDWLFTVSGFLVGLIVGVTGVGGGSLMTPLLVLFFGISPATAVGTDLLYASITKSLGGWVHSRNGTVDWTIVKRLSLGSLPAACSPSPCSNIWRWTSRH